MTISSRSCCASSARPPFFVKFDRFVALFDHLSAARPTTGVIAERALACPRASISAFFEGSR